MRFTIEAGRWYACEFLGGECENFRYYSPIKVEKLVALGGCARTFNLHFYHADYPEGVRDKVYKLQNIERVNQFLLARCLDHQPALILLIFDISVEWLTAHYPWLQPDGPLETWLDRNV